MRPRSFRAHTALLVAATLAACSASTEAPDPAAGPADFTLRPASTTLEVDAGGEVSSFVELGRQAGFSGAVRMAFSDLPSGFTQEWTRDDANGDCSVVLRVAEAVEPGAYSLTLVGEADEGARLAALGLKATAPRAQTIVVVVGPGQTGSTFSLSTSPSVIEVAQGNIATFRVKTLPGSLKTGNVALSVEGVPAGAGVFFAQNPVALGAAGTDAQIITSLSTLPQAYTLKVKGVAGGVTKTSDLKLTVRPAADAGFNLRANPASQTLVRGVSAGGFFAPNVSIERLLGFGAPVTFSVQNLPPGVDAQFVPSSSPDQSSLRLTAGPDAALGATSLTVKAEGGGVVQTTPIALEIVSGEPQPLASNQGAAALDAGFGPGGFRVAPGFTFIKGVAPLPGGRALVLGGKQFLTQGLAALVDAGGALDPGFGTAGFVELPIAPTHGSQQPDGKILLAASIPLCDGQGNCNGSDALVMRLNADGSFDPSFDGDGQKLIPNASAAAVFAVAGKVHVFTGGGFMRLDPNGALDLSFDGDGLKVLPGLGLIQTAGIALDAQNRLVVYGKLSSGSANQVGLARFSLDGVFDVGFGQGGKAFLSNNFILTPSGERNGLTIDATGRLLVAGMLLHPEIFDNGRTTFSVARLTANGTIDTSFGEDGVASSSVGQAPDEGTSNARALGVAVTPNGKILAVGQVGGSTQLQDYAAARWNDDGSVDASFGQGGKFRFGFQFFPSIGGKVVESFFAALPSPDGRVTAFGTRHSSPIGPVDLTLARFNP